MSLINLHNFVARSRVNGPGERTVIWVQGCPRRCPGCFNPDSLPFVSREETTVDALFNRITAIDGIRGVTFSGGEPFSQAAALAEFAKKCHERGLDVGCFTGYTRKQLQTGNRSDWTALLGQVDLLIDGPFISELCCDKPLRGSSNQELYFLTGRIQPEEVSAPPRVELTLDADGGLTQTGFPETSDADAAREFLENFRSSAAETAAKGDFL